jgi:hypothetical protein
MTEKEQPLTAHNSHWKNGGCKQNVSGHFKRPTTQDID